MSARLLVLGLATFVVAGCLATSPADPQPSATPDASTTAPCDAAVESERIRSREIDLASDPMNPQRMAAGMMSSIPATREAPPDDEPVWIRVVRSDDGGKTWRGDDLTGSPGSTDATSPFAGSAITGDPVVAFLPDGTLLMSGIMIRADYSYVMFTARFEGDSLDATDIAILSRGAWGDERLGQVWSPGTVLYNDKQEITVDPATGTAYVSWMWRHNDPQQGVQSVPVVVMSTDGGVTWTPPKMLFGGLGGGLTTEEGNIGQFPFTTSDGMTHIVWWAQRAQKLMISSAPTGTVDFAEPRVIADRVDLSSQARAISFPLASVAVAPSADGPGEAIYVIWSDSRNGDADVLLIRSDDGGASWTEPVPANTEAVGDGTDQLVPVVAASLSGVVGVHYISFNADASEYDARASISLDGGRSFTGHIISSEPTKITEAAGQRGTGIQAHVGDYFGAAFTDDAFVAMWQDGRNGSAETPFTEAYACRLPV